MFYVESAPLNRYFQNLEISIDIFQSHIEKVY